MNYQLYLANRDQAAAVTALRHKAYANPHGFQLDLSSLAWRKADDDSYVLVVANENTLFATMRGEVIDSPSLLAKKLECTWQFPLTLSFPLLLLSRAATLAEHQTCGFNLLMRYYFIQFALAQHIRFLIGTFIQGASRQRDIEAMGYSLYQHPLGWQQSTYRSLQPVTVAVLDLEKNAAAALKYCETKLASLLQCCSKPSFNSVLKKVQEL